MNSETPTYKQLYAIPSYNVPKDQWAKHAIEPHEAERLAKEGRIIAVLLEDEDFGCIDFDTHNGPEGMQRYHQLVEEYKDFFSSAHIESTKSGGRHVYFAKNGVLHQSPWASVDLFDGHSHRWLAVAPTRGYRVVRPGGAPPLPDGLRIDKSKRKQVEGPQAPGAVAVPDLWQQWRPQRCKFTMPKRRKVYDRSHKPSRLCDCGAFFVKPSGSEWKETTRHQEFFHYGCAMVGAKSEVGPYDWNQLFSMYTELNDEWQCGGCGPKFTSDEQIKADIFRLVEGKKMPSGEILSRDLKPLPDSNFFCDAPHAYGVIGYTETFKSTFVRTEMLRDWRNNVGGPVLWFSADESHAMVNARSDVPVTCYYAGDGGASEYVLASASLVEMVHKAMAMKGIAQSDTFLIVFDPFRHFIDIAGDEYKAAYRIGSQLRAEFPNAYTVEVNHVARAGRGGEDVTAFGSMAYEARYRMWSKLWKDELDQVHVTNGGNLRETSRFTLAITDDEGRLNTTLAPYADEADVKQGLIDLLETGQTPWRPSLEQYLANLGIVTEMVDTEHLRVRKPSND